MGVFLPYWYNGLGVSDASAAGLSRAIGVEPSQPRDNLLKKILVIPENTREDTRDDTLTYQRDQFCRQDIDSTIQP